MFNCEYKKEGNLQEFILTGKLDQETFSEFDSYVQHHYTKDTNLLLNLETLDYISSVGLRSFIAVAKLVRADKKNINIKAKDGSMVRQLIMLSGFSKLMPFV